MLCMDNKLTGGSILNQPPPESLDASSQRAPMVLVHDININDNNIETALKQTFSQRRHQKTR